jgi:adenylate cyclase
MTRIRYRDMLAAAFVALAASVIVASPLFNRIRPLSLDFLTALRWQVSGPQHPPETSPAVVVAIDEESYRTPPLQGTPTIAWTGELARVLTAVLDGGAKVVGFDIIFPTLIEQSEIPFGEDTLGNRVRGFDRDFLRSLALAARSDKVVLGQLQRSDRPIRPSAGQLIAVGQQRNVRALNAYSDSDNVVRRMPLMFTVDGSAVPSLSLELASRAQGAVPQVTPNNRVSLAGYRIRSTVPNTLTLNFDGGADSIPTYSFADLRDCAAKGDTEFFKRNFSDKVVLVGSLLDFEDLKLTSKRFATGVEAARAPRCALPPQSAETTSLRDNWISGVYIHATAVNNLIRRDAIVESGALATWGIALAGALFTALVALAAPPLSATFIFVLANAFWAAIATMVFAHARALPLVEPFSAGLMALVAMVGYRFVVTDSDKRFLRRSFAFYLAPAVIEKMVASDTLPELGGEIRDVTVYFSDIANFSSFSEKMTPGELVSVMNRYLSAMTDIIEAQGGFVDKYIGDAIVAVFGAPLDDASHARSAVRAALRCQQRLSELREESGIFKDLQIRQRIGLNSGEALVGNIGSRRRFNYTVMGDTANLASRLEGANKFFGTFIMASEMTMTLARSAFRWRELDAIRVKGRVQPVKIFEPLAEIETVHVGQFAFADLYAEGLAHWRARNFTGAGECFAKISSMDAAAAHFLERARKFASTPPGSDWEPINTLEEK